MNRSTKRGQRLSQLWASVIATSLVACSGGGGGSGRKVAGGTAATGQASGAGACFAVVNGASTAAYPGVAMIGHFKWSADRTQYTFFGCSGTFVSSNTMVTASHCIPPKITDLVLLGSGNKPVVDGTKEASLPHALKAFLGNPALQNATENTTQDTVQDDDVALVVFAAKTSKAYHKVARSSYIAPDKVRVVGYGSAENPNTTAPTNGTKRTGTNVLFDLTQSPALAKLSDPFLYTIAGRAQTKTVSTTESTDAVTAPGDSGGPLFSGDLLMGSSMSGSGVDADGQIQALTGKESIAHFHNLTSPAFAALAKKAEAAGGKVLFEDDDDPEPTPADEVETTDDTGVSEGVESDPPSCTDDDAP